MDRMDWPTDSGSLGQFAEARIEAQNAVQWLARLARSYAIAAPDADIKLRWDRATQKIVTPDVAPDIALELALPTLTLQFLEKGQPSPHAIDIEGKSSTEVEAWLLVELLHRGFDRDNFSKKLPYKWAHLMSGDEAKYSPEEHSDELRQLTQWYERAAGLLVQVKHAIEGPDAGVDKAMALADLICWPDRFDIGFYVPMFGNDQEHGAIKVGFTAGDDEDVRPCFFVCAASTGTVGEAAALPISQISEHAMSPAAIVGDLLAKVRNIRLAASN